MRTDDLREEYDGRELDEAEVDPDPFQQFSRWFDEAVAAGLQLVNGMVLATVARDGQPSTRVVLLKQLDDTGLVFFSNYDSRKGRELAINPRAAGLFWWIPLHRQVRVEGRVERISGDESDAYFRTRPRASNLSAIASPQSQIVPDRRVLETRVSELEAQTAGHELERPDVWGGYRLVPDCFEFFQGRADRLHDRLRYLRRADSWQIERLAP